MCIIIVKPKNKKLPADCINNCWSANHDGAGIMYAIDGKIHMKKYKYLKELKKEYNKIKDTIGNKTDIVLHFRFATHGTKDIENVHPFMVHDKLAFCHNGIFDIEIENPLHSDTQAFNEQVLKMLPPDFLDYPCINELLRGYVGTSNKLVFLADTGKISIFNEECGEYDTNGIWYSNSGYKFNANWYTGIQTKMGFGKNAYDVDYTRFNNTGLLEDEEEEEVRPDIDIYEDIKSQENFKQKKENGFDELYDESNFDEFDTKLKNETVPWFYQDNENKNKLPNQYRNALNL